MNGSSSHQLDIILTPNGEVQKPISLDMFLIIIKIVSAFIGIPFNTFIVLIIIRLRRLHSKPRNIFLLAMIVSNLLLYFPSLIELIYWFLPLENVCRSYVAVIGLPNAILLWTIFLALADRYVAIKHPLKHKEKVTVRRAIVFLLISIIVLAFIMKFIFIVGLVPIACEIWFVHSKVIGATVFVLFTLCIVTHVIVYRQTKILLQESRTVKAKAGSKSKGVTQAERNEMFNEPVDQQIVTRDIALIDPEIGGIQVEANPVTAESQARAIATTDLHHSNTSMIIHVNIRALSQMEMEATRTLIAGVTSLFVMASPPLFFFLSVFLCRLTGRPECASIIWLAPYFREVSSVWAVYNPLLWLFRNGELWLILKSKIDSFSKNH
ncbi:5-hydroxytryptamine receptor 2B-like [Daphnia carinata]|uniref:5-hydroxytryptamine receptor 2B-like n=1 Tax=Daphnia carinata TaxID=120202 RepID=UPI002579CB34|nr:5-hydroxytryptamine receptor 2B-like [Daphnia carinata]